MPAATHPAYLWRTDASDCPGPAPGLDDLLTEFLHRTHSSL